MNTAAVVATRTPRRTLISAVLALVVLTAIWGSTFALSKDLLTRISVPDYLAMRFLIAAVVIAVARPRVLRRLDRRAVVIGAALGACYCGAQAVQFVGLKHTAPTVSAFVLSLYVVFTPLITSALTRSAPKPMTLVATGLATVGVATMSLRGWALGFGELLTVCAAGFYAVHILALGRWSTPRSAYPLTFVQLLTMGLCFLTWALVGGLRLPAAGDVVALLYLAVVAGAVAMLVQTWAQAHVSSSQAAVLMVLEPVWAAFFGFTLWHEALDARTVVGAALVLLAMLLIVSRPQGRAAATIGAADTAGVVGPVLPVASPASGPAEAEAERPIVVRATSP